MDKLPNCRVCLAGNVQMYLIFNKNLHELYKKLTDIQFETLDRRPMLACYLCCTRLKQCYQLQKQCQEAEELFAQMMNEDIMPKPLTNPDGLEFYNGLVRTTVVHINISDESQVEYDAIKEELPKTLDDIAELKEAPLSDDAIKEELPKTLDDIAELKEAPLSDDAIKEELPKTLDDIAELKEAPLSDEELDYSGLHEEEISAHHPEPYSEDDVPLMEIKTEVEEEAAVSEENQIKFFYSAAVAINRKVGRKRRKLEDGIIEEENNTEQSNTKIDPKIDEFPPGTGLNINKPSNYANPEVNNITLATIRNGANKEDKSSKSTKSIDSHDVNKHRVQSVKRDDLDKLRVQGDNKIEKQFICGTCFRVFSNRNSFIVHIRGHTGEKPFKCDICDRGFSLKATLITHFRIHTGEKPYKCILCQSSFNRKLHLEEHIRIHSGEKPYKCTICQSSFIRKHHLEQHIRLHSGEKPYKCTICQKSFNRKSNLIRHGRVHSGEKPYKCTKCQSSFNQKTHLETHIRAHTREKPYKCTISYPYCKNLSAIFF